MSQGWTTTRLPSGELRLDLHRRSVRMALELGLSSIFLGGGIAVFVLGRGAGFEANLWALLAVSFSVGFILKVLMRPSPPSAWVLARGRATLERRNGKTETFAPTMVVIETFRQLPRQGSYMIPTTYAVFLQAAEGKIPVHDGFPLGDRHELARTVAEAVGTELVEVMVNPPRGD